jgi:hypothetical protein
MAQDPVVAEHYAGFAARRARAAPAQEERRMYVSFRVGESVYWTRASVRLAAGETLLTDGVNLARARCGNRLSLTPRTPIGPDVDLDVPVEYEPAADGGDAGDVASLPLVVHEIFPAMALLPEAVGGSVAAEDLSEADGSARAASGGILMPEEGTDDGGPVYHPLHPVLVPPIGGANFAASRTAGRGIPGIPEPGTVLLVVGGTAGIVLWRRVHENSQRARSRL